MTWRREFKDLLVKLAQDPKIKAAMETARVSGGGAAQTGMLWQILSLSSRFVGKKRARAVAEAIDAIVFLVTLSLIVKQNIFDRPEVRTYFARTWNSVSIRARSFYEQARRAVEKRI